MWQSKVSNRFPQVLTILIFIVVFGGIGTWLLTSSHASTATSTVDAAGGAGSGNRCTVTDNTASSGAAVKFGCAASVLGLDQSGTTIPTTNYSYPDNAIFMSPNGNDGSAGTKASPVLTLNKAIGLVPAGGTIVAYGGTYRDWYNSNGNSAITTKGFTLQPYPGQQVWFDGTDVEPTSSWTSDGSGHWYMNWNTSSFCNGHYYDFPYNNQAEGPSNLTGASGTTYSSNAGPCSHWDQYGSSEANYPAAGDPQMVFVDGKRMAEVDTLNGATGGNFYYDWSNKRIYISTNPAGHTVELAARPDAFILGNASNGYIIRGVGFRRYASNEYSNTTDGAVYIGGNNPATVENDVFTQNAAVGLSINTAQSTVNSTVFAFNGFNGAGYYGHDHTTKVTDNFVVENSVFNNNNTEHYGLNCSLSCAAAGIKMAAVIGYTLKNNIFENGVDGSTGAWCDTDCFQGKFVNNISENNNVGYHYEQDDGGIIASNVFINNKYGIDVGSTNTKIYNNTFINNPTIAIRVYDDNRPLITSGISIANNVVYGTSVNVDWFGGGTDTGESSPTGWFSTFDYNSYWRPSNFILYRMIGSTDTHYNSSATFQAAYPAWEAHAQDYVGGNDPFFVNEASGDYTIRSDSAAYHSGTTIPSDVAAALGITTTTGLSRGALSWPGQ